MATLALRSGGLPLSAWWLLGANLVPLAGAAFLGWDLASLLLLFWAESVIIGAFNAVKMAQIPGWERFVLVPFFVVHYGGFMAGHLLFLAGLILPWLGYSPLVAARGIWPGVLALAASHGASYWLNFARGGERRAVDGGDLMTAPYPRVVVMHLTIIFGAFAVAALGSGVGFLVLLVALKTAVDLHAHLRERKRHARPATQDAAPAPAAAEAD